MLHAIRKRGCIRNWGGKWRCGQQWSHGRLDQQRRSNFSIWRFCIHRRPGYVFQRCRLYNFMHLDNSPHGFEPMLRPVLLRLKLDEQEEMRGQPSCVGDLLPQPVLNIHRVSMRSHVRHSGADDYLWLR